MQNYSTTNFTRGGTKTKTYEELVCSPSSIMGGIQSASVSFAAVNIFLAVTAFLGNSLILVALHKESSLHPPSKLLYRCLATTDLLVGLVAQPLHVTYLMSVVHEHWSLCHYAGEVAYITGVALCGVSLLTMAVISVDRLLALLLGLRYKEIVTLKRIYIIIASFWVLCLVASLCIIFDQRLTLLSILISIPLSLLISLVSYTKIFRTLRNRQGEEHDQLQPSQPSVLNMARYRKAVHSALWIQLVLVVCYTPYLVVGIVVTYTTTYSSHLGVALAMATILVHFNSTLNPFLYCWKISEVRQTVKQTIREALY